MSTLERHRKPFTPEEDDLLIAKYGMISLKRLASLLKRTPHGVQRRADRLKLGSVTENAGAVSIDRLAKNFNVSAHRVRRLIQHAHDFPVIKGHLALKRARDARRGYRYNPNTYISIERLWNWLELHPTALPLHQYTKGTMLPEPEWLTAAIETHRPALKSGAWTDEEVKRLLYLSGRGVTGPNIAKDLNRTTRAIYNKLRRL